MSGCHDHGFSFSGTLYADGAGTTPAAGSHIVAVDANGQKVDVYAQKNGNFYSTAALTYPLTVYATSCPSIQHMTAQVTQMTPAIGCNNCHATGQDGGIMHL